MSFKEFYDTDGGAEDDANGGTMETGNGQSYASDGPHISLADCTSNPAGDEITNNSATGWGQTAAGDGLCFDIAGTKQHTTCTGVAGEVLSVSPAVTELANKGVNVGGAWENPNIAYAIVEDLQGEFSDGTPPRLNVQGDQEFTGAIVATVQWTKLMPFVIQGYGLTPGDNPATKPVLSDTTILVNLVSYDYTIWADLHFQKTGNNADVVFDASDETVACLRCTFEATDGTGIVFNQLGVYGTLLDCVIKNTGSAAGKLTSYMAGTCAGCRYINGQIYLQRGSLINCRGTDVYFIAAQFTYGGLYSGTINIAAGQDGVEVHTNAILPVIWNTIITGAEVGQSAAYCDDAAFSALVGGYNCWYNDGDDITDIANYIDGEGDVTGDPDLDADDRPKPGSSVIGTGHPAYINIGAMAYQPADAEEIHLMKAVLVNKRTQDVATGVVTVYDDAGTTPILTITPSESGGVITLTPATPNSEGGTIDVNADAHLAFAMLTNKREKAVDTGVLVVKDDDGSTTLKTLTPSTASGVTTVTPS